MLEGEGVGGGILELVRIDLVGMVWRFEQVVDSLEVLVGL